MKKATIFLGFTSLLLLLVSWGFVGHRTVARIAEHHLTPNAKAAVRDLLGSESLAEASTWADEVRGKDEYKQTGPWHYVDLPLGLSYAAFKDRVENMLESNVYSAVVEQMRLITDKNVPREKKVEALKFIVHFVGDLHQPMHVSRAEDKGGNTIQVNFEGQGTNLHALWDSKLIDHQGLNDEQLATQDDHATAAQIRQWQSDPLIKWMYESYQIATKLYAEIDSMNSRAIGQEYYDAHIAIVNQRLEQGGIRLAGLLNTLFKDGPVAEVGSVAPAAPASSSAPVAIDIKDAASHVNETVIVTAQVYGYKALEGLTLVNLGAAYPDQPLTLVLKGDAMAMAADLDGKVIKVTGKVEMYKGKPEIVVRDPKMISK
jgi:hypothetical protein